MIERCLFCGQIIPAKIKSLDDDEIILADISEIFRKYARITGGMSASEALNQIEEIIEARMKEADIKNFRGNFEMCKKSIDSGVCPKSCEICAWSPIPYLKREKTSEVNDGTR